MQICPPEFFQVAQRLEPDLENRPGKLIAIDGRDGVGKTSLGRFLACYFSVSLVETDLFLRRRPRLTYCKSHIQRIIDARLAKPRPVIVEGILVLKTLQSISRKPDILIYVTNTSFSGSECFAKDFSDYETTFSPQSVASIRVVMPS